LLQCSISECKSKAVQIVRIGFKEKRNLCRHHYDLFKNKDQVYAPSFNAASKL